MVFNKFFCCSCFMVLSLLNGQENELVHSKHKVEHYSHNSIMQQTLAEEALLQEMNLSGDEVILDIGCGDGRITQAIASKITTGHIIGIDKSPSMIQFAKEHYQNKIVDYYNIDVENIDKLNMQFDVITIFSAFHWFSDPKDALTKMSRCLKKGGKILIVSYPRESQDWPYYREAMLAKDKWASCFEEEMFDAFFSSRDFADAAKELHLKVIKNTVEDRFQIYSHIREFKECVKGWLEWFAPKLPLKEYEEYTEEVVKAGKHQFVHADDGLIYIPYKSITVVLEKPSHQESRPFVKNIEKFRQISHALRAVVAGTLEKLSEFFKEDRNVRTLQGRVSIKSVPRSEITNFITQQSKIVEDKSFHVVDLAKLKERVLLWQHILPNVRPYFSVKTNHDPVVLETLASLGIGFDCSTIEEITNIQRIESIESANDIIFAHPRKPMSSIERAVQEGVKMMVIDSIEELEKITQKALAMSDLEILIRIKTNDSASGTPLSSKFGATIQEAKEIINYAVLNNIKGVKGVSFHVGSNNKDPAAYEQAIKEASEIFAFFHTQSGLQMTILDIGGGWPGDDIHAFVQLGRSVGVFLERYMPSGVKLVAEPGRFLCADSTTLVSKILGKKVDILPSGERKISYYINNGVYGFFLSSIYYNHDLKKSLREGWQFKPLETTEDSLYLTKLWGPTLDSGDLVVDGIFLPELEEGDLILTEGIGCYGKVYESSFSQQAPSIPFYIFSIED